MNGYRRFAQAQEGAILIVSLVLLLALTVIGAMTLSTGSLQELMAANSQLVSTNRQAAQTATSAFVSEGSIVFADSLPHNANQGVQLLRVVMAAGNPGPTATESENAVVHCIGDNGLNTDRTAASNQDCAGAAYNITANAAGSAPVKSRRRAYYLSCAPAYCPSGMATSLDQDVGLGCPNFYVEGAGYLDVDGNGLPPAVGNEEAAVFEHQWLRWRRSVLCEG